MRPDLQSRVTDFVRQHPGLTLNEIARGVRSRTSDVADVLASEAFYASPRGEYLSDRAQVYQLAAEAGEKTGRARRRSQCSLIAAFLADGAWHTTSEIHQRCGFSRLNSRIAELRSSRAMVIESKRIEDIPNGPEAYAYRLVETSEAAAADPLPQPRASEQLGEAA
jgi:hypothetical protein